MLKTMALVFSSLVLCVVALDVMHSAATERNALEGSKAFAAACQSPEAHARWMKGQD